MKFDETTILYLILQSQTRGLTSREELLFESWLAESPDNRELWHELQTEPLKPYIDQLEGFDKNAQWAKLKTSLYPEEMGAAHRRPHLWLNALKAASVLLMAGLLVWYFGFRDNGHADLSYLPLPPVDNILLPDSQAVLILSDGRKIILDSVQGGIMGGEPGGDIVKHGDTLQYAGVQSAEPNTPAVRYNILAIPKGRRFHLIMPDGSRAWLSPGSALRFPVTLDSTARLAELRGEAFFDVTRIKKAGVQVPFTLKVRDLTVNVLGTRFMITSYTSNKEVRATLLKGSVSVKKADKELLLKPGEQATLLNNADSLVKKEVDTTFAYFYLKGELMWRDINFAEMMEQIGREFNLEIVYTRPFNPRKAIERFHGGIDYTIPLQQFLNHMSQHYYSGDVRFVVEKNKIIVIPIR